MASPASMITHATGAAILLAAGESSRFGGDKLAARLGRETVLALSAQALIDAGWHRRAAVLCEATQVHAPMLERRGFDIILNHAASSGLSTSLRAGLAWAEALRTRALLVAFGDMPLVTTEHYRRRLERYVASINGIAYSTCGEQRSPPAIFSTKWFPFLTALESDQGDRSLLYAAGIEDGVIASSRILADIDTQEDLIDAERLLRPAGLEQRRDIIRLPDDQRTGRGLTSTRQAQ